MTSAPRVYGVPAPTDPPRIVAVVVTFNRRDLLARLLEVLQGDRAACRDRRGRQRLDRRDCGVGGLDRLDHGGVDHGRVATGVPVHLVALDTNTGGAGGFHTGMLTAVERGADLIWLMDDDGVPADGCLTELLDPSDRSTTSGGPAVLAEQDPGRLCFPIRLPGRAASCTRCRRSRRRPRTA